MNVVPEGRSRKMFFVSKQRERKASVGAQSLSGWRHIPAIISLV